MPVVDADHQIIIATVPNNSAKVGAVPAAWSANARYCSAANPEHRPNPVPSLGSSGLCQFSDKNMLSSYERFDLL